MNVNIQKKPSSEEIEKVIEFYEEDYARAKKIENDDDKLLKISGDDTIENQIKQFDSLNQLSFSEISDSNIVEIKNVLTEEYRTDIEIPEHKIIQWIDEGLRIHQKGDDCKMCGGKLDYSAVKTKIEQYKENKKHKAVEKIKTFQEQLLKLQKEIETINNSSKFYIATIGNIVEKDFQNIVSGKRNIEMLISSIQNKIDNIGEKVNFDFEGLKSVSNIIKTSIANIKSEKSKQLTELRKKQDNLEILVKGAIGLEIKNSLIIKNKLEEIEIKDEKLELKRNTNKQKRQEIQNLKQQKSPTKDFAVFVSKILKDINISLKVEVDIDNHNYIIKHSCEEILLTINDISEGEKNLLALLFFYYELFNDNKQQQIKNDIELIIVDDPISSMDDSNKFYILELMKNLLNFKPQIFVLTHSWDDFYNLSYGKGKDPKYKTFEIRKNNNGRSELMKLSNIEKPYKYLFMEIYDFSQKNENEIGNDCEIYHYPNVMRRIFEEWYSFKIGKDLNLTTNMQDSLGNDLKIKNNDEKTKLGILLKICNVLSHSINNSKNPQEIHQAAKFLMELIGTNDKLHFDNMKVKR